MGQWQMLFSSNYQPRKVVEATPWIETMNWWSPFIQYWWRRINGQTKRKNRWRNWQRSRWSRGYWKGLKWNKEWTFLKGDRPFWIKMLWCHKLLREVGLRLRLFSREMKCFQGLRLLMASRVNCWWNVIQKRVLSLWERDKRFHSKSKTVQNSW